MEEFVSIMNEYIRSELIVVVPVLYIISKMLNSSNMKKQLIPITLMGIAVTLAGIYTFATVDTSTLHKFLMAIFSTLIQGILLSGSALFGDILAKTMGTSNNSTSQK